MNRISMSVQTKHKTNLSLDLEDNSCVFLYLNLNVQILSRQGSAWDILTVSQEEEKSENNQIDFF